MMIDDVTGNITHIPDSVILNIETSSSTNSSSESRHDEDDRGDDEDDDGAEALEEQYVEEEEIDVDEDLHCDDWEIRMLAAELNRRESKREEPISSETTSEADDDGSGLLRRRSRQRSDTIDTDTEYSEMEADQSARPRAASLDQHNLRRQKAKGVYKAMSFDRDKDRL